MAAKRLSQKVLDLAGKFVAGQDGAWEHADWELFAEEAAALGFELTDESRRNLGNILEAAKYFHCLPPLKKARRGKAKPAP
ncbi:MAG TPA: hypothetical protein PKI11_05110 [Candidatus Hydrogenedentes bacterium]|nr:hypothetical protein [Candidatus Hydrogenedentota bacterium]